MGNVYMEADQVRFKNSTYHNLQTAVSAALEGGGGGGTTVIANPEGSATADLGKLQVGTTIYGIPDTVTGNPSGSATAGNLTKLQIGSDIYNVPSGGSNTYGIFSTTETEIGTWINNEILYRKVFPISALPSTAGEQGYPTGLINVVIRRMYGEYHDATDTLDINVPPTYNTATSQWNINYIRTYYYNENNNIYITVGSDRSSFSGYVILEYTKNA